MAAEDKRGQLWQKREGGSIGQEATEAAMLVASDKEQWQQQEAVVNRCSKDSRVTVMFAAATGADKRSHNNGCIGQEAPSTAKRTIDWGTGWHHTGGQR
jgi:hypothetical protein